MILRFLGKKESIVASMSSGTWSMACLSFVNMQATAGVVFVAIVVQRQETVEDLLTGALRDGETGPLFGFVEAMPEVEVVPTVVSRDRAIQFHSYLAQ